MAQVITRCRLSGYYMFMGMDVDPKEFARSPSPFARKFCPFCACDHWWHKEDSRFLALKPVCPPRIWQGSVNMSSGAAGSGGSAALSTSSGASPDAQVSKLAEAMSSFT
jgi:hypothetical protein